MTKYVTQIMNCTGDDIATATRRLSELEKFLAVIVETGEVLVPSQWVDEGWHALLDDHLLYEEFLAARGLRYVRHIPGEPKPAQYQLTLDRLQIRYGTLDSAAWPAGGGGAGCSDCNGEAGFANCSGCGGGAGDHE